MNNELPEIKRNFHGPFYRASDNDKWHWKKECPVFPKSETPQTMITSVFPDSSILCEKCFQLHSIDILKSSEKH